jgi:hypothetical protein
MPDIQTLGLQIAQAAEPYLDLYTADEALSALRVVRLAAAGHVVLARPPELQAQAPVGVTTAAAMMGGQVELRTHGEMQDASWSWTVGPVLLSRDGVLTQSQPAGIGFLVVIGFATASDTLLVRIGAPLQLAL